MDVVFCIILLLLAVEIVPGSNVRQNDLFPDESGENSDEFLYGKQQKSSKSITNRNNSLKFRIESADIPCANKTTIFCEEVTNQAYPTKYLESVLVNTNALQAYENYFNKPNETLGSRIRSDEPTFELCDSIKRFVYPQLAMNVQHDWHFIINQPRFQQPIRVEICQKKNTQCLFNESLPNNFVSACVQKYTKVPLLSLGEDGEILTYDYEFPSSCQCQINLWKSGKSGARRRY